MNAISFETVTPRLAPDPDRMDVACFVGFIAERPGVTLPGELADWLLRRRLAAAGDLAPGRADRLLGRPVPLESADDLEALFEPDARLDGPARVAGQALPADLPTVEVDAGLDLIVDGRAYRLDFQPAPATPAELLAAVRGVGAPVTAELAGPPVAPHLRLARADTRRPGRLTVLANPAYGFEQARTGESRALGSPLGQALRAFFAMGGRRAYVIRMGDPLPYLSPRTERWRQLHRLLLGPAPAAVEAAQLTLWLSADPPDPRQDISQWYGPAQVFGLEDVSHVLLPDLPELVSPPPPDIEPAPPESEPREVFSRCTPAPAEAPGVAASDLPPPRMDREGLAPWRQAAGRVLNLLRRHARDKLLLLAVPPAGEGLTPEPADLGLAAGGAPGPLASAFLQLAEPWLLTAQSRRLPGALMPPDAVLAAVLANNALSRGAYLTAAGQVLPQVIDLAPDPPLAWPALSRFARTPRGIRLEADRTASPDPAWQAASVSRLLALLVRAARGMGDEVLFQPSGERLWRDVRVRMETWLTRVQAVGGLAGLTPGEGFRVRCDRSTMTQADIDNGRLIVEVTLVPARSIEGIQVTLSLGNTTVGSVPL